MRQAVLSIVVMLSAALSCLAKSGVTNIISSVASVASTTNTPALKLPRQQCEAVTKSGNRCKRNAVPGEKQCRQHLKIANRKSWLERVRDKQYSR